MKTPVVALFALTVSLAVGHLVEADNEPSVGTDLMRMLFGGPKRRASPHIAGGSEVKPHSHPHQVAILTSISKDGARFCGGSLIAPQWILTAAHCVAVKNASVITVMGAHNLKTLEHGRQIIPAKRVFIFDSYDEKGFNDDIALVQLSTPAKLNDRVKIIRLPSLGFAHKDLRQTSVTISGWGRYNDRTKETSSFLKSATTYVVDNMICSFTFGQMTRKIICIDGLQGQSVCRGDSGGPLVMAESDGERTLIGVASFGSEEGCEAGHPAVFTRVDRYLGWIVDHTGIELRK